MRILVTAPRGKTGQRVIAALQKRDPSIAVRGISRTPVEIEGGAGTQYDGFVQQMIDQERARH